MYAAYKFLTSLSAPILHLILKRRLSKGKELPERYLEKTSIISKPRPTGTLFWVHGASVGESQSALILIDRLLQTYPDANILVTTGTVTSAALMDKKLPENAFHQFFPLDHPKWAEAFLEHWKPDAVFWMESELWPNMLSSIKTKTIPAALINARMSEKSFKSWNRFAAFAKQNLSTFDVVLCQTDTDKQYYDALGAQNVTVTDNLKYSAAPLSYNQDDLDVLQNACEGRPLWLYASTHDGEEQIAHDIHQKLQVHIPDLLTIIVPRHPERRSEIEGNCKSYNLQTVFRGENKVLPDVSTQIYIADTLGELGLFYTLSPIACIGRSLSLDGGGGHNPIEAAQLGSAVIYGKNIQNLQDIYDEMHAHNAALLVHTADELYAALKTLLQTPDKLAELQNAGARFSSQKTGVIDLVMSELSPLLRKFQKDGTIAEVTNKTKNYAS